MPTRKTKKSSMGMGRDLSKPLAETVRPEMSDKEYFDLQSKLRQKARAKMSKQAQLKALSSIEKMKD
jgi:hypothetical protein